ncbi:platelet glycoprotein VI [Pteronotus mesoamericanus]|uniref:platelet glycoprotein VI n=1 Tax=Pteronotus mesoamericanus TaxID=1884717 RepID=UPI0023ECC22B|nr:platelet glycoprotein VI [Pteronotus parnellii mesoamericanus]
MSPSLSACFCLGLCLGRVIQAQLGLLPKPSLQAQPTSLVPWKTQVTLRCQGPPGVDLYRLENLRSGRYENKAVKVIQEMTPDLAGPYRCSYQNGSRWSSPSEQLKLVVTGVYEKPTLTAQPSPAVSPGGDVTLHCHSTFGFDCYALYKTGDKGPNKGTDRWYQADFPITTVTAAHSGTYHCYSFSSQEPYMWSAPSDPLELVVTGTTVTLSRVPAGAPSAVTEPSRNNITIFTERPISPTGILGNLVRICFGVVILIFLVGILAEDWYSRKKSLQYLDRAVHRPLPPLPQTQK